MFFLYFFESMMGWICFNLFYFYIFNYSKSARVATCDSQHKLEEKKCFGGHSDDSQVGQRIKRFSRKNNVQQFLWFDGRFIYSCTRSAHAFNRRSCNDLAMERNEWSQRWRIKREKTFGSLVFRDINRLVWGMHAHQKDVKARTIARYNRSRCLGCRDEALIMRTLKRERNKRRERE